jgi:hypothetical protein
VCLHALAADVVYVDNPSARPEARRQVADAAKFYGLSLDVVMVGDRGQTGIVSSAIRRPETLAVAVAAAALGDLNQPELLASLRRPGRKISLLVVGIDEYSDSSVLRRWSGGAVLGGIRSTLPEGSRYAVVAGSDITRQLGGSMLPLVRRDMASLALGGGAQRLLEAGSNGVELPVFAKVSVGGRDIFFAANNEAPAIAGQPDPYHQQAVFAELAAPLFFLNYAAGERAWHSPGDYANFTIDDLWLREPYGHVNYEQLLRQAQQHNYHVTIAFIPWNFDRSQAKMVSLFRDHPDRLSICVHGNDHVHQEFGPLDSHPLEKQLANMRQGLARMDKFTQLTGLPYDPVMVFPHSVAPRATFAGLKENNYLATANSLSVPSDASAPAGADFALRTATLDFANFPSLRRYSAETDIPETQLAIDAFLGNPMLFYAHESFFAPGIGEFNKTAETVNKLQPDTQWQSLGYIVRHLYLEKLRSDGDFDIRAYSASIDVVNHRQGDATFFVEKDEDFSQPLTVLVDGRPYPFVREGNKLKLKLAISKGATRQIAVRYGGDSTLAAVDIAKTSPKTNAIRLLSDFRDNVVSTTELGRRFIRSYADNGRIWDLAFAGVLTALAMAAIAWRMLAVKHRSKLRTAPPLIHT